MSKRRRPDWLDWLEYADYRAANDPTPVWVLWFWVILIVACIVIIRVMYG